MPSPAHAYDQIPVEDLHNSVGRMSVRHRIIFTIVFENSSDIPAYVTINDISKEWHIDEPASVSTPIACKFTIRPHNERKLYLCREVKIAHREAELPASYKARVTFTVSNIANQCIDKFLLDSDEVAFYMHGGVQGRYSDSGLYAYNPPQFSTSGEKTAVPQGSRQYPSSRTVAAN